MQHNTILHTRYNVASLHVPHVEIRVIEIPLNLNSIRQNWDVALNGTCSSNFCSPIGLHCIVNIQRYFLYIVKIPLNTFHLLEKESFQVSLGNSPVSQPTARMRLTGCQSMAVTWALGWGGMSTSSQLLPLNIQRVTAEVMCNKYRLAAFMTLNQLENFTSFFRISWWYSTKAEEFVV